MSDDDRPRLVRRATMLLAGAQAALWAGNGAYAAFGPLSIESLTGRPGSAAQLFGVFALTGAASALVTGRVMDRVGRRPGLLAGYALIALAGLVAHAAVSAGSPSLLYAAGGMLGAGTAAALLGRAAVADMYPPERRGRAVGLLVVAGTFGAIGGPLLAGAVHSLAEGRVEAPLAVPWLLVPAAALVGGGLVAAIRTDPRHLAAPGPAPTAAPRRPTEILRLRPATSAVVAIGVGHAVMVTLMAQLPASIHRHGAGEVAVSVVVAIHMAGMFAFSPLFGSVIDRWGRRAGLLLGATLSAAGALVGVGLSTTVGAAIALLLIGMGWSAAYLGSTAVLSDLATPWERGGALGAADLVSSLSAGAGTMGGAALLAAAGLPALGIAAVALLAVVVALVVPLREIEPGRWALEPKRTPSPTV